MVVVVRRVSYADISTFINIRTVVVYPSRMLPGLPNFFVAAPASRLLFRLWSAL
jgi:hypothetical protein